jgi:hypothetical protein
MIVTAEHKTNKYGTRYVYYHCSKRGLGPRCRQRSGEQHPLERQFADFLASVTIDKRVEKWALAALTKSAAGEAEILPADGRSRSAQRSVSSPSSAYVPFSKAKFCMAGEPDAVTVWHAGATIPVWTFRTLG